MTVWHSDGFQKIETNSLTHAKHAPRELKGRLARAALIATSALVLIAAAAWGIRYLTILRHTTPATTQPTDLAIGGFPMPGDLAPDFNLIDQFGRHVTLSSLRGREVVLAFIDSRCKTLCPLTAEIMYDARARLGSSATSRVALVAINANPSATSVATVQAWSINHGMLHQWSFLTGSAQQLESVYHSYHVYAQVDSSGQDVHDPATFIIDTQGHERLYYETLGSNSKADLSSEEEGLEAGMQQWLPRA
jgi:cytochrome oxidase Cu insertion factor (SCO1/SenC/PrrC family)